MYNKNTLVYVLIAILAIYLFCGKYYKEKFGNLNSDTHINKCNKIQNQVSLCTRLDKYV